MTETPLEVGDVPIGPNDHAWFAMGLSLAPLLMIAYAWWLWDMTGQYADSGGVHAMFRGRGGAYWSTGVIVALAGTYQGIRGHNFAVRGLATNGRMARFWGLVGIVVAIAVTICAFTLGTAAMPE